MIKIKDKYITNTTIMPYEFNRVYAGTLTEADVCTEYPMARRIRIEKIAHEFERYKKYKSQH